MINLLTGTALSTEHSPITCLIGGVGYAVHVAESLRTSLHNNQDYTFFIHTSVKEDSIDLYGFVDKQDLGLFQMLITVSGIGPKTALHIVDRGTENVKQAIQSGSTHFFTGIPRLGTKNAQKIIIDLRSKLSILSDQNILSSSEDNDAIIEALISMGFTRKDIVTQLSQLPPDYKTTESKIRALLKILGKKLASK